MATAKLNELAIENYGRFMNLPRHCTPLAMVQGSSAGMIG